MDFELWGQIIVDLLIKNANVIGQNYFQGDILIKDGKFAEFARKINAPDVPTYDAKNKTVMPGLIDVHVHFREPGFEAKETIKTGAMASAHGGFTTVCAMPNLNPVPDNIEDFKKVVAKNDADAMIHVKQFSAISEKLTSDQVTDYQKFVNAGAIGFSNDGFGVQNAKTMLTAMQRAKAADSLIAAHIEDASLKGDGVINAGPTAEKLNLPGISNESESSQLARDLQLAASTGVHYHACHISTAQSVELIRQAKKSGVHVTAEVSPHHLLLGDANIVADDPMFKMNPPLRSRNDQLALIEGLADGTIDLIATDHAPHTKEEKSGSFLTAAFGIVGVETSFALIYTKLVRTGMFTLNQLIDWMSVNPAKEFKLNAGKILLGKPADLTIVDLDEKYTIDPKTWFSKGTNSPFIGEEVYGKVLATIVEGAFAYQAD